MSICDVGADAWTNDWAVAGCGGDMVCGDRVCGWGVLTAWFACQRGSGSALPQSRRGLRCRISLADKQAVPDTQRLTAQTVQGLQSACTV